ncbi:DapH/DapD/GlmU-related protein [Flavobacterium subsaxonicum]|uniref:Acetyltransferase n=1 Tax=Flavobacterium subsaxonicum WB 4.1-42 = DSM 21790 TaxID=1121898 RepID=A0A0A2ML41_9FLAO|nr:DapH/DapD/GlmU-related protein [Flavobacterium subsaxonicum]KGO93372.1 acetyltransferase [Flavobacterium subsaxonicum WB 4.1-42 = DSM 21790]
MVNTDTHTGASFSLKNRLLRVLWGIVYFVFFKFSPRPLHGWRSFILKCFGAKVGKGVHVYPGVIIWAPWNLILKDHCGIASGVNLYSQGVITVGEKAVISQGSYICTGTHDYTKTGFPLYTLPIAIGDDTWVAADVFIHPGVTIGNGCVIGARSVVTKNMPAWMVCAGFPCKVIKERAIVN